MYELTCPKCGNEFDASPWDGGFCPGGCGLSFDWDEIPMGPEDDLWADSIAIEVWKDTAGNQVF